MTRTRFIVTATEYIEYLLIPKLIQRLHSEAPGVDLEIRRPNRDLALAWLEAGEIHLGIGWLRHHSRGLKSKLLLKDRFVGIARHGHPSAKAGISLSQYLQALHIRTQVGRTSSSGSDIDKALAAKGARLRLNLILQNYLTVPHAVVNSDALATVPERLARMFERQLPLQIFDVPLHLPALQNAMYWHERTHHEPSHQWFRQFLLETVQQL